MLPESSIRQLKKLRQDVKGIDINDKVAKDETHFPNVYWMDNPVDGGRIQSYEDFIKKDNKKQTTAFKSKLVNKTLVNNELNEKNMNKIMKLENLIDFKEFDITKGIKNNKKISKEIVKESMEEKGLYLIYSEDDEIQELFRGEFNSEENAREKAEELYIDMSDDIEHYDVVGPFKSDEEIDSWISQSEDELVTTFEKKLNEAFKLNSDVESKNPFGFAQVKNSHIKKIGSFTSFTKMIDPKTPKERTVLNAGQFIDNDIVQGYVNRIEGNKVFIESLENPGEIIEVSIKDAVKIKKEKKEHTVTKKFNK